MEAEAQCAALEADGIVDGVVTEACQIAETPTSRDVAEL